MWHCCLHLGRTKLPRTRIPCGFVPLHLIQYCTIFLYRTGMLKCQTLFSPDEICCHFRKLIPRSKINMLLHTTHWLRCASCYFTIARMILMKHHVWNLRIISFAKFHHWMLYCAVISFTAFCQIWSLGYDQWLLMRNWHTETIIKWQKLF